MKSCIRLNTLNLNYHNPYDHKTRVGDDGGGDYRCTINDNKKTSVNNLKDVRPIII